MRMFRGGRSHRPRGLLGGPGGLQLTGVNAMNAMCYVVCISRSVSRLRPDGASLPRLPTHCHEDSTTDGSHWPPSTNATSKLSGRPHMSLHALEPTSRTGCTDLE
ncbi:hypothetical protein BGZ61DRAFT_446976 [Ilyonectria robusta]|uniref:uncharacterized protein n=1 Tax=Ilyonectria robusta TaxID=1079257 RepID=UPI001E8C9E61|nr:uncharacterized protein BGZ61DRAFT_446976 [Ilyonectria robusta]KAH8729772.1 hypothetical protein BGZ61DRAFT_446976 [Ilyonectria robusta]